jgi:hypothetical protein
MKRRKHSKDQMAIYITSFQSHLSQSSPIQFNPIKSNWIDLIQFSPKLIPDN